ncbi:MAG TPA: type IV secretion system DNA-binding domain-containing protein [Candidatus Paceibacterota bacterium]|nr:type IV secretion system DNA-binding domain-containing protein [Candidatus Paceibacterota bacterium]
MPQDPDKITYFASTNSRGESVPFGIKRKDRARHMYVIGKTGMGKSTLLENMAIQDIRNGEGMAFIDPHGGTADRIMEYVPEHRKKDVVYFAPFDMEHPIAFNVMEDVGYDKRHLVVSGLLSAFKKLWVDSFSARMEYILSNTLLALLEYPGATMLDVNRMLVNKNYRKKVVDNVKDPIVKDFWNGEFANYSDRYTQEATPAIQNKVGQFTSNPLIRNIIGQPKSSFDLRELMDQKKILIINLSKGRVGDTNTQLLGSMLVTKIYLAAMSRADVSASTLAQLPQFYFYVDEFQNFANQSFADILSEARKYKLNLIIAHQYIEQMEEEVRDAVFGNVGTTIAFRVGPFDAEVLETIYQPVFMATDLVNLGFAQIYLTLMIDGVGSPPFSATTLAPFDAPPTSYVEEVIANSRKQYGKSRAEVEAAIQQVQDDNPLVMDAPKPKKSASSSSSSSAPRPQSANVNVTSTPRPAAPASERMSVPAPAVFEEQIAAETAPAPMPLKERAAEVKEQVAKAADHVPHEPRGQSPQVRRENEPRPRPKAPAPKPTVAKPPLSGATSLRDALLQAQAHAAAPTEDTPTPASSFAKASEDKPAPRIHAPDLKNTLHTIAPQAEARSVPAQLPEDEIRSMLDIDDDIELDLS